MVWTAGVAASPIPTMLGTKTDRAGRALVDPFLRIVEAPGVFVVGDAASVTQNEHPVPGVAQAAIQEGQYVGRLIAKELRGPRSHIRSAISIKATWQSSARISRFWRAAVCE